jgi:CubicO group peptidase (beta-lactamase class C family)
MPSPEEGGGHRHHRRCRRCRYGRGGSVALALALLAAACSSGGDGGAASPRQGAGAGDATPESDTADVPYPGAEWTTVDPVAAGFDPAALARLDAAAEAAGSSCLVVTRDGAVVDERYWDGAGADQPREAFSVTKSITSTLVGIAQDEGALGLDDPAADHIAEWRGTDSAAVTLRNLVSNDSGRHWDFATDYTQMALGARDKTGFAVGLGQDAPPGEVWAYNNSAIQTLSQVLGEATGEDPADYAESRLFGPIGMDRSSMSKDGAGNTMTFMGLRTTCLDLARFGYLMLNGGRWDGDQVVSQDWVEAATGRSSTELNAAYGYLWWLNRRGAVASPAVATTGAGDGSVADGQMDPGVPDDVFWALGFQNQIVAVVPSEGIVAVRMGAAPPAGSPFTQAELTGGVLDAVVAGS